MHIPTHIPTHIQVAAIRRACVAIGGEQYTPKLVFVVVQKRNHCRLFHESDGQIENALPGTVVDSVITTASQASRERRSSSAWCVVRGA